MNKHIEVVKRWQAGEEVSVEALKANADAAWAAYAAAADGADAAAYVAADAAEAAYVAADAGYVAYADAAASVAVEKLVKLYEEMTNDK